MEWFVQEFSFYNFKEKQNQILAWQPRPPTFYISIRLREKDYICIFLQGILSLSCLICFLILGTLFTWHFCWKLRSFFFWKISLDISSLIKSTWVLDLILEFFSFSFSACCVDKLYETLSEKNIIMMLTLCTQPTRPISGVTGEYLESCVVSYPSVTPELLLSYSRVSHYHADHKTQENNWGK